MDWNILRPEKAGSLLSLNVTANKPESTIVRNEEKHYSNKPLAIHAHQDATPHAQIKSINPSLL